MVDRLATLQLSVLLTPITQLSYTLGHHMAACYTVTGIASVGTLTTTVHSQKIMYILLPFTECHFGNIMIQDQEI
jgi:hypothetical protein